jgi:hypothetical protein
MDRAGASPSAPARAPWPRAPRGLFAIAATVLLLGAAAGAGPAPASASAKLKPKVGWGPLSSKRAKRKVVRTTWEPRPQNRVANHTVPTRRQIKRFRRRSDMPYARYVNGRFRGTTDDVIEWAAYKWGLPERVLRAVAVHETWWDNTFVGDDGDSFGLFQVRRPYHCCLPMIRDSTAFNADYYGGVIRSYYDGLQGWLNNPDVAPENGRRYRAGDFWGSVGAWYSGRWRTAGNAAYVAAVKQHARERTWKTHPFFDQ